MLHRVHFQTVVDEHQMLPFMTERAMVGAHEETILLEYDWQSLRQSLTDKIVKGLESAGFSCRTSDPVALDQHIMINEEYTLHTRIWSLPPAWKLLGTSAPKEELTLIKTERRQQPKSWWEFWKDEYQEVGIYREPVETPALSGTTDLTTADTEAFQHVLRGMGYRATIEQPRTSSGRRYRSDSPSARREDRYDPSVDVLILFS